MQHPEISVVVSTYNRNHAGGNCQNMLVRAIESILNQTFKNFELILIDDASTDGTEDVCRRFAQQDPRIRYIRHSLNSQRPAKRYNEGIALSKGKFLAFMFDDDEWMPNALSDLHAFYTHAAVRHPNLGMVYGLANVHDLNHNAFWKEPLGMPWSLIRLFHYNYLANCAVLVKRNVIDVTGGYDEHDVLRRVCDWELWQRIGMRYTVLRLDRLVATVYTNQPDSIGMNFQMDIREIQKYISSRKSVPLKCKEETVRQRWNYFKSSLLIHFPLQKPLFLLLRKAKQLVKSTH